MNTCQHNELVFLSTQKVCPQLHDCVSVVIVFVSLGWESKSCFYSEQVPLFKKKKNKYLFFSFFGTVVQEPHHIK